MTSFMTSGASSAPAAEPDSVPKGRIVDEATVQQLRGIFAIHDTDRDGLADGIEVNGETDPLDADTDGDRIRDGEEDLDGDGAVDPGETDPRAPDTDGDGIDDGIEDSNRDGRVDPGETDPRRADTDGDGLDDQVERTSNTSATDSD